MLVKLLRVSKFDTYGTTEPAHEGAAGRVVGAICRLDAREATVIIEFQENFTHPGQGFSVRVNCECTASVASSLLRSEISN